jgi:hypothetical protein
LIYGWPKSTNIDPRRALQNWPGQEAFYRAAGQKPNFDIDFTKRTIVDRVAGVVPVFTRSSTQLAWDGSNFISYAPDVPAFRLASDGVWEYLHEPAATNIFLYSRMIGTGWETPAGVTTSTVSGATPEQDWYRFVEDTSTNRRHVYRTESSGLVSGNQYTASFVCRRRAGTAKRFPQFVWNNVASFSSAPVFVAWDLDTLAFGTNNAAATGKVTRLAADIFLLETTITATATGGGQLQFGWNTSLNVGNNSYVGDGVSGFDFTLPQLELGPVATSRIYANGSYITRSACSLTIGGKNFASFYDQSGGVWYTEASINALGQTAAAIYSVDRSGDGAERMQLIANATDGSVYTYHADESVIQSNILFPGQANNSQRFKAASSFSLDNCNASVNGSIGTADTSATLPSPDRIAIGAGPELTTVPLLLRRLTYFPPGITQSRIQQLTIPDWWDTERLWRIAEQRPALDIEFNRQGIVDRINGIVPTFTRPSVKLARDGSVYREYAVDEPAFQKAADGTWEYLHEPAATNLCINSNAISGAGWVNITAPVTADALVAPDGTLTGDIVSSTSATFDRRGHTTTYTSTGDKGISTFIRQGSSNRTNLTLIETAGATTRGTAIVTWSAGVPQLALLNGAINPLIEGPYNNGWWRVGFVAVGVVHTNAPQFRIQPNSGDGSALDVGIWGVQLEDNASITSPIITAGSAVTRAADLMTVTGSQFLDWYAQAGGTVYFESTPYDTTVGSNYGMYSISSGTYNNGITVFLGNGLSNVLSVRDGEGASQAYIIDQPQAVLGQSQKLTSSIAVNNVLHSVDGASPTLDNVATVPTGLDQLHIGRAATAITKGNIGIRRLTYFPPGSSQNRVQQLSGATLPDPYANAPWLPLQANPLWITANQLPTFDLDFTSGTPVNRGSLAAGNLGTFSRPSSIKQVWNGTQYVSVPADTPALQLDPVSGLWGVLMEPAATNLWTRSHDLTNAGWSRGAGATYANVGEIATGANIMQITENLASSTRGVSQSYGFTAGVQATASIFVRKGTTTADSAIVSLGTASGQFAAPCNGIVNLTTGAVSSVNNCVVEATAYGPWWRISISATPLLTATSVSVCNLIKGGVQAYAGDGAGTAFMALPQLETGSVSHQPHHHRWQCRHTQC